MSYWQKELDRANKEEGSWIKRAKKVVDRYADERDTADPYEDRATKFNILWANTETLRPSLISATPSPEVRPRYRKKDPVSRVAAKILERALEFSLDQYDFIKFGRKVVQDYLLPGRGVARIEYLPTFEKKKKRIPLEMREVDGETRFYEGEETVDEFNFDEEGAFVEREEEELVFEEVRAKRVPWQWFRMEPADCWDNVNWVAFGAPYSKEEGQRKWGKKFQATEEVENTDHGEALKNKVIVWEIWDKRTRKQIFWAEGVDEPLEENDDPLELEDFFPVAEPIYIVQNNDTMVPTPEFCLWQDQADELDLLSERIRKVTEAIKARGAYAGEEQATLSNILHQDDNKLVAVDDWAAFIDKGGLDGLISWVPVEQFAKVLQTLEQQRAVKVQEIYELTGVSDILRGSTDPRETASAQKIKERTGSRRLLTKQDTVQRLFRDIYRLKAEIIAEQFDKETLRMMVGLENTNNKIFDQAIKMIKSDVLRSFNVDVETDSTIAADEQKEKEGLAEAMQATASYVGAMFPLVQAGAIPMPVAMGLLQDYLRKFRFGRRLDDLLEEFAQSQPKQDDSEQQKQNAEMQKMQMEMQAEQQKMQLEMQKMQAKMQLEMQKEQQKIQVDAQKADQDLRQDEEKHEQELRQDREMNTVKVANERELGEVKADVQRKQAAARPRVQE